MRFIVDTKYKFIIGWSAKCGCTHIKNIMLYIIKKKQIYENIQDCLILKDINYNEYSDQLHNYFFKNLNILPTDIHNYTTIIITRNPYKRIISGLIDKYKKNGEFRHLWSGSICSFELFLEKIIQENKKFKEINYHHFIPQTEEQYSDIIFNSKILKCYDINNIDYNLIEKIYNIKLPKSVIDYKGVHINKKTINYENKNLFKCEVSDLANCNISYNYFYNEKLKNMLYKYYEKDFDFCNKFNIKYDIDI